MGIGNALRKLPAVTLAGLGGYGVGLVNDEASEVLSLFVPDGGTHVSSFFDRLNLLAVLVLVIILSVALLPALQAVIK